MGVISTVFFAWIDGWNQCVKIGTTSRAMRLACSATEIACVQPKFSSFDQISLTLIGLLVTRIGGSFAGKKSSLMRSPKLPNPAPHLTASRLLIGPFGTGRELKNCFRLSQKLSGTR